MKLKIKEKLKDCIRVIKLNKAPSKSEFLETFKICVTGIAILGIIGFIIYIFSVIFGL
ncbi:MAG: protein translocase SEC61 complex subunit gamma [Candidatus Aenigmatarchaeota archaeon]